MFVWIGKWEERRFCLSWKQPSFYVVSVTAERWSRCSDLRESHMLWGAVLSPTLREHPVGDMAGQRRRGRSCWSVICSLTLISCWYWIASVTCAVLGLVSKLMHKNCVAAQEKRGMYRLSYWWETGAWVWVSFGSRCALPNLHPGAAVLQESGLTWVSCDTVLQPPHATIDPYSLLHWAYSQPQLAEKKHSKTFSGGPELNLQIQ